MTWNFWGEVQFGGGECHGARYIRHFYCLAVEAGFYSDVVECLPVDPATWVRFPAGAGKIFLLYECVFCMRGSRNLRQEGWGGEGFGMRGARPT